MTLQATAAASKLRRVIAGPVNFSRLCMRSSSSFLMPPLFAYVEKRLASLIQDRAINEVFYAYALVLTSAEDQKLVAVEITEVRAVRTVLIWAARTWTPLVGAPELQCKGVYFIDMGTRTGAQCNHVTVAYGGTVAIVGIDHAELEHRRSKVYCPARLFENAAHAEQFEQFVIEVCGGV